MDENYEMIRRYLSYCHEQKRLDQKTIRAYSTDLLQFNALIGCSPFTAVSVSELNDYVKRLHKSFKPKTVKRKIASVKALYYYLEYNDIITYNAWRKVQVHFREPVTLPRIIAISDVRLLLSTIYYEAKYAHTVYRRRNAIRDAAVCELLFSTGIRIFELCSLTPSDVDFREKRLYIQGKGSKERIIHIGNEQVLRILSKYREAFSAEIESCGLFFVNQSASRFSDQAVRRMINHYTSIAGINQHITPHMFRHTFATSLLEADVDIRYIQEMLGHSSIHTTEIYTHVSTAKQKAILSTKHPRNMMDVGV